MARRTDLDSGALDFYQKYVNVVYGKNAEADLITVDTTYESATITAIGAGKKLNGGDLIYIYPTLLSIVDVASATDANTLEFDINYYKNKEYFLTESITVTFSGATDLTNVIFQINAAIGSTPATGKIVAEASGDRLRFQATGTRISMKVTGGTGLVELGLAVDDYAKPISFKNNKNLAITDTDIAISEYFTYGIDRFTTTESLKALRYVAYRNLGQCTDSTFTSTFSPDTYKGSSKMVLQTEYADASSTLSIGDLTFNRENLDDLKGLVKRDITRTFFSGKTADVEYKYGSYSEPKEFSLVAFKPKKDGIGLQHLEMDRAKAPSLSITMAKAFRTSAETIDLMANSDRVVAIIYSI